MSFEQLVLGIPNNGKNQFDWLDDISDNENDQLLLMKFNPNSKHTITSNTIETKPNQEYENTIKSNSVKLKSSGVKTNLNVNKNVKKQRIKTPIIKLNPSLKQMNKSNTMVLNSSSAMLCDKIRPRIRAHLIGNKRGRDIIEKWLKKCSSDDDDSTIERILMLTGPCGCGKSKMIQVLAHHYHFRISYIDLSQPDISPMELKQQIISKLQDRHIRMGKFDTMKQLIIIDGIEQLTDLGLYFHAINSNHSKSHAIFESKSSKSKSKKHWNPLLCIGNTIPKNLHVQKTKLTIAKLWSFTISDLKLIYQRVISIVGTPHIMTISQKEKFDLFLEKCGGDARYMLNHLEISDILNHGIPNQKLLSLVPARNGDCSIFETMKEAFFPIMKCANNKPNIVQHKMLTTIPKDDTKTIEQLYYREPEHLSSCLFENYLSIMEQSNDVKMRKISTLVEITSLLSESDILESHMKQTQDYSIRPHVGSLGFIYPTKLIRRFRSSVRETTMTLKFPQNSYILQQQLQKQYRFKPTRDELLKHIHINEYLNSNTIMKRRRKQLDNNNNNNKQSKKRKLIRNKSSSSSSALVLVKKKRLNNNNKNLKKSRKVFPKKFVKKQSKQQPFFVLEK